MKTAGLFDKETAKGILETFRALQASGLLRPGVIQELVRGRAQFIEEPKRFTNMSGETIPPYACMQIVGTEELGDNVYLQVDKPADTDGTAGAFIFNWHYEVEAGKQGVAQKHRIVRAYTDGTTATAGDNWQPVVGDWTVEQNDGGRFAMCGEDSTATNLYGFPVAKIEAGGGGDSSSKIALATSGITARSGTTVGSGTCTEYKIVGTTLTTNTDTFTVYNIDAVAIPSGMYVMAVLETISGKWIAQHPGIINLRLSGSDLQYTLDGTTWTTWTTATACV